MRIKKRVIVGLITAGAIIFATCGMASAKVDSYLIKDKSSDVVYEYETSSLIQSFLASKTNDGSDPLYDDFVNKFSENGFFAFHDDTDKYVDYSNITAAYLDSRNSGKVFDLNKYTESSAAPEMTKLPAKIKVVNYKDGKISYEDKSNNGAENSEEDNDFHVVDIY